MDHPRQRGGANVLGWTLASAGIWCAIGLLTVGYSLAMIVLAPVLCVVDPRRRWLHHIATLWGVSVFRCMPFCRLTLHGRESLGQRRAYIFVSNHQSLLDIMALFCLHRHFKWVAKESLFRIPFLGWSMSLAGYIKLARGRHGSIRKTYEEAQRWLRSGVSVFFFPEGTRSRTGQLGPFKDGAFKLSLDTGVPLVPIAIEGTRDILSRGSWVFSPRSHVRITVLRPLQPAQYAHNDADQLRDATRQLIQAALEEPS